MWGATDKASGCSVPEAPFHSVSTAILSWVHKVWSSCIPIVSFNQPLLDNWGKLRPRGSRSHFPLAGELRITFIHFILSNIFKHFIGCQAPGMERWKIHYLLLSPGSPLHRMFALIWAQQMNCAMQPLPPAACAHFLSAPCPGLSPGPRRPCWRAQVLPFPKKCAPGSCRQGIMISLVSATVVTLKLTHLHTDPPPILLHLEIHTASVFLWKAEF